MQTLWQDLRYGARMERLARVLFARVLLPAAVAASLLPAARAARIDVNQALSSE